MKKLVALVLVLLMLCSYAFAEDLGVQVISPDTGAVATTEDDLQLGGVYPLDGCAIFAPVSCNLYDCFAQFGESGDYSVYYQTYDNTKATVYCNSQSKHDFFDYRYRDAAWMDSGASADYLWFVADITNLQNKPVDFSTEVVIKVVYQDDYEFSGWMRQINYDHMEYQYGDRCVSRQDYDKKLYPTQIVMNPKLVEEVDTMYTGTYVIGCTLPNYVINDKESPLRIEIELGGNELTYHIRK